MNTPPATTTVSEAGPRIHLPPVGCGVGNNITALLPRRCDYAGLARSWRGDVMAGVTVGVVALPLALAFGITTGLGAQAGLITAIVAGFVAAVFGGSNVQVSGPTGAMTVVLVPIVARYGAGAVYLVGMMAGVLVVLAAVVRLGRFLAYMPWPVIEGFTVGIALHHLSPAGAGRAGGAQAGGGEHRGGRRPSGARRARR